MEAERCKTAYFLSAKTGCIIMRKIEHLRMIMPKFICLQKWFKYYVFSVFSGGKPVHKNALFLDMRRREGETARGSLGGG